MQTERPTINGFEDLFHTLVVGVSNIFADEKVRDAIDTGDFTAITYLMRTGYWMSKGYSPEKAQDKAEDEISTIMQLTHILEGEDD